MATAMAAAVLSAATPNEADDVLVSGRLLDEVGKAIPDAMIVLQVWPSREVRAEWTDDEQFELDNIGSTFTNADGSYAVRIDPGTDLSAYQSEDGFIDIDVLGLTEEGLASYSFNIVPDELIEADEPLVAQMDIAAGRVTSSMRVDLRLGGGSEVPGLDLDTAYDEGDVVEDVIEEDGAVDDIDGAVAGKAASSDVGPAAQSCPNGNYQQRWDLGGKWVNIGSTFRTVSGPRMRVQLTSSGESTLGIGVSVGTRFSGYKLDGTVTQRYGTVTGFPLSTDARSRHHYTKYHYEKTCYVNQAGAPGTWRAVYRVKAFAGWGGVRAAWIDPPSTPSEYCERYPKGSTFVQKRSTAVTWSNGARVSGGSIDIDLSSRTGFTSEAQLRIGMEARTASLCGTNGPPAGTPRRLVLRP